MLVVAELLAAQEGLAFRMVRAGRFRAVDTMFAVLIVFGLLGLVSDLALRQLRKRTAPWSEGSEAIDRRLWWSRGVDQGPTRGRARLAGPTASPSTASTCTSRRGRWCRSSAPRGAASRRCSTSSAASTPRPSGEVRVGGDLVVGPGPDRGMVFQGYSLFPWKSVRRNISFGLECAGWPKVERRRAGRGAGRDHEPRAGRRPPAGPALRRHAPAGRHRPGPRPAARHPPARRALRGPRRPDPTVDARVPAPRAPHAPAARC